MSDGSRSSSVLRSLGEWRAKSANACGDSS